MTRSKTLLSLAASAALLAAPAALAQGSPGGMGSGSPATTGKGGAAATGSATGGGTTTPGTAGGTATGEAAGGAGDKEILSQLHMANQQEVEMGKLGKAQGHSKAVKDYAGLMVMVKDHTAADKEVAAAAKKAKIALEAKPKTDAEKADHKQAMDDMAKLKKLKGAEFDREFMTHMVQDHDKVLQKVDGAMATASGDVKALLEKLRPQLQQHRDEASKVQGELK